MGDDEDGGGLGGVDLQQQVLHAQAGQGVERAEGLVEQQHLRAAGERPGEGGALGHAAGDLAGAQVRGVLEADQLQQVAHPLAARLRGGGAGQAEGDVLLEGAPGQQARLLEGDRGALVGADEGRAAEAQRTGAGPVQARDEPQEGRLPAAGGADDGEDLAGAELEVETAQHVVTSLRGVEGAGHAVQPHAVGCAAPGGGCRGLRDSAARARAGLGGGAGHGSDYDGAGREHARIAS